MIKRRPIIYCQLSAILPELKLYSHKLIKNAPITAPINVPLPPIATQMTIVIEYVIDICVGVIEPLKLTNSAPAMAAKTADRT